MDMRAAILHLARAGIDARSIYDAGINPRSTQALRTMVDNLLAGITDGDCLADARQFEALCEARQALRTDGELAEQDALVARLVADLESYTYDRPPCEADADPDGDATARAA